MSRTSAQPSAAAREDAGPSGRGRAGRWLRTHLAEITLAILAGGLGGVVLYLIAEAL